VSSSGDAADLSSALLCQDHLIRSRSKRSASRSSGGNFTCQATRPGCCRSPIRDARAERPANVETLGSGDYCGQDGSLANGTEPHLCSGTTPWPSVAKPNFLRPRIFVISSCSVHSMWVSGYGVRKERSSGNAGLRRPPDFATCPFVRVPILHHHHSLGCVLVSVVSLESLRSCFRGG